MTADIRDQIILALESARSRGDVLTVETLWYRLSRGAISLRLVETALADLIRTGFASRTSDGAVSVTEMGSRWLAAHYEVAPAGKVTKYAPRDAAVELPLAAPELETAVRREKRDLLVRLIVMVIASFAVIVFFKSV